MTKKEMIEELKGQRFTAGAEWFKENDPEMLDWITGSEYWRRGFDEVPPEETAVIRVEFGECGVTYTATANFEGIDVDQALNNQSPWGENRWDDWEDADKEYIKKYYDALQG